jgi:uroporphyrinogen decarboxylase
VPSIVFTKGGGAWLGKIAAIGCDAVGVDWTTDLATARARSADRVALQGNLDPSALFAPPDVLRAEDPARARELRHGPGHVFNLGHGITPDVDPERVAVLVETCVHGYVPRPLCCARHGAAAAASQLIAQRAAQDLADVGLRQLVRK